MQLIVSTWLDSVAYMEGVTDATNSEYMTG